VAELGEGDDRASVNRVIGGRLDGGPGSDTLSGAVAMTGGAGDDRLHYFATNYCRETLDGGDGADILDAGGDGVSTLGRPNRNDCGILDGGAGPDVFRGGGLVSYTSRTEPVTVTLDGIANDGAAAEGDQVLNPLAVYGGAAGDNLTGSPSGDGLYGGPGNDRLFGGAGDDYVTGEGGADWVDGQDGDDFVFADDHGDTTFVGDVLIGGSGSDRISGGEGNDDVRARDGAHDEIFCAGGHDKLTADAIDWEPGGSCEKRING
jgi:Ca2+-binding RTX toxin-like protein